jgi:hypothetical protein
MLASQKATIGELTVAMSFTQAKLHKWNDNDYLTVKLLGGDTYSSYANLLSLANGANLLAVGDCIVQYKNASELSPGIWKLQGLWYGRYGTDSMAGQNFPPGTKILRLADENAIFDDAVKFIPVADSMIGTERHFEVFSYGDENKTTGDLATTFHARAYIPPMPTVTLERLTETVTEGEGEEAVETQVETGDVIFNIYLRTRDWESAQAQPSTGRPIRKSDPDTAYFKLTNGDVIVYEGSVSGVMNPLQIPFTAAQVAELYGGAPPAQFEGLAAHEGTLARGYETLFSL